jgi:mono/diheme cytochrome c family protein
LHHFFDKHLLEGFMFRTLGSNFARSLAMTVAAVTLTFSLALAGCGSSGGDTPVDSGPTVCTQAQVDTIFAAKCTVCHGVGGAYAGLDLSSAGLATRLVGVAPPGGGSAAPSMCTGMGKIYLTAGSNPATGLLLEKIISANPSCGVRMPFGLAPLSASDIACVQSWSNTVTAP